ncbi:MAG: hypothetical protein M1818_006783 [Claussenomyces sp. TS43310]|nr:MAG: hypothetical protein M1818_006783 [Claussenomyces sp. TS43310]
MPRYTLRGERAWKEKLLADNRLVIFFTLSLTCHRTYIDVVEGALLYQQQSFQFFYPRTLVHFLSFIPQSVRNAIQNIQLAFPWSGKDCYHHVIAPKALRALCTCSRLRKLSLAIATSTWNRSYAEADYTHGGAGAIKAIEVLTTRLAACDLIGLRKFDVLLWDPQPWVLETLGAVVVGSGMWTDDAERYHTHRGMTPASIPPGHVNGPHAHPWSDATKRKLEMLVEKLKAQVTATA